jgi:RHS repeat-associated protein
VQGYVRPINVGAQTVYQYVYQYRDHLGDNRLSYADDDQTATVHLTLIEESNYDAFGMKHQGYNNVISSLGSSRAQGLKYNGKELQEEYGLNWYDYGARFYDPAVGRWHVPDPMAEKYYSHSPYCYVGNNPISRIDPDGNTWGDIVVGFAIGVATNIIPGSTSLREHYTPDEPDDYNSTLRAVDNTAATAGASAVILGSGEMAAGGTMAAGGLVATASVVGAPAGVPVAIGGGALALKGAATAAAGGIVIVNASANKAAGYNYGNTGKGKNNLKPDSNAGGDHSTIKVDKDGKITNTATYKTNPKNPTGFDEVKRVDVKGASHDGVPTPHVHVPKQKVRPAKPEELPRQ